MANHKSAIKRHRQSLVRRARSRAVRSKMKTSVKALLSAIEEKDRETVQARLKSAASVIAKTAAKGGIHHNAASRTISRLTRRANVVLQAGG